MVWNSLPYNSHHYYYFEVIGCFLAWDAHICLSTLSEQSVETLFLKDALGCSWDARDAQDAFQSDPKNYFIHKPIGFLADLNLCILVPFPHSSGILYTPCSWQLKCQNHIGKKADIPS